MSDCRVCRAQKKKNIVFDNSLSGNVNDNLDRIHGNLIATAVKNIRNNNRFTYRHDPNQWE